VSNLEPRIEAVRQKYGLEHDDFWQIKQNKQWVCKHAALEIVAVKAGVEWLPPQIIEANAPALVTSMIVTGKMGDRTEWATGETNATNYSVSGKQPAYPWAMAEKRAKDRVVLKLVGIHGLVYSEDEAEDFKAQPREAANEEHPPRQQAKPISAAQTKRHLETIDNELVDCRTPRDVEKLVDAWIEIAQSEKWSKDYWDEARRRFARRKHELAEQPDETVTAIQEQFPGATVTNERLHPLMAG